jgi:hypothetical protein
MNDSQQQIGRIAPVTDDEAARLAHPGTLADLAAGITATPAGAPGSGAAGSSGRRWRPGWPQRS